MRVARLAFVPLFLLAACGGGAHSPAAPQLDDALAAWNDFPADRDPRPIILTEAPPNWPGFNSGDAKIAAMCAKFGSLAIDLPSSDLPPSDVSWPDGSHASYPSATAVAAYAAMRRRASDSMGGCAAAAPLTVSGVRLGKAGFQTDRGTAQVPAWLFSVSGAQGDVAYPAVADTAFWAGNYSGNFALLGPDGRSLTFHFTGGHPGGGPCEGEYSGSVAESRTAVAVMAVPIEKAPATIAPAGACSTVGYDRAVTVALRQPLGRRVVVVPGGTGPNDQPGAVVMVCPEHSPARRC